MSIARWKTGLLACLFAGSIAGCSSGDGIEGTGKSEGSGSGFGSVFVNGVEFETGEAGIVLDGEPAAEDDLQVGMVLSVSGSFGDRAGDATRVKFDRRILGPVDSVTPGENRIVVLGQTVRVDANTVFAGASLDTLGTDDLVVVSGFLTANDETLATRVERRAGSYELGSDVDVEGVVRDLTLTTCRIGDLRVDYTGAIFDLEGGPLVNGAFAEAVGTQSVRGGTLQASRFVVEDPIRGAPGERVALSGLIRELSGPGEFSVDGQPVNASSAERTDNADLAPADDVRIVVEGTIDENRVLVADTFALRPPSDVSIVGTVDSVDPPNDSLVVSGTTAKVEPTTQYEDESPASLRTFRIEDLEAGDTVDVRGYRDADDDLVATRLIRLGASGP